MNKKFLPFIFLFAAGTLFAANAHDEHDAHKHAEHDHAHEHKTACAGDHDHAEHAHEKHEHEKHEHGGGCEAGHAEHDHEHDAPQVHDEHDGHDHSAEESAPAGTLAPIEISARARESIAIRREKVSASPATFVRPYYGQLAISPSAIKTAALPVAGRVKFFVKIGENVRAGTSLLELSSPALVEMFCDIRDAEAALAQANVELATLRERLVKLESAGIKNSELVAAEKSKQAEIKTLATAAERAISLMNLATQNGEFKNGALTVFASENATVQSLELNEGAWGEQGAAALTLTARGELEFKANVFGNDSLAETSARLALTFGGETKFFSGTLRASPQIAEDSQMRTIYFRPENLPAEAFAGQIAKLEIFTSEKLGENFVLVPNSAVIKVGVEDIVFVCVPEDENRFVPVSVKTLPSRRGMTPVSGVSAGATVVTKGGYELKYVLPSAAGAQKKTAGHFHADGKFHEGEH